jgi:hypothetical protein
MQKRPNGQFLYRQVLNSHQLSLNLVFSPRAGQPREDAGYLVFDVIYSKYHFENEEYRQDFKTNKNS